MSNDRYKFKVINQRIKDKLMSLKVHVKACASVCKRYPCMFHIQVSILPIQLEEKQTRRLQIAGNP
jgi:hypothetical protein